MVLFRVYDSSAFLSSGRHFLALFLLASFLLRSSPLREHCSLTHDKHHKLLHTSYRRKLVFRMQIGAGSKRLGDACCVLAGFYITTPCMLLEHDYIEDSFHL